MKKRSRRCLESHLLSVVAKEDQKSVTPHAPSVTAVSVVPEVGHDDPPRLDQPLRKARGKRGKVAGGPEQTVKKEDRTSLLRP